MKAVVCQGPGRSAWQDVPDPAIEDPADAIVRVDVVTICGAIKVVLGGPQHTVVALPDASVV